MDGYLHLKDQTFKGSWTGDPPKHDIKGEVVFFTGMTGYQEVLTDPSYKGKIVVFTYPLIGNYGINKYDAESMEPQPSGVVVYEAESRAYHYESEMSIGEYLQQWNIPLLSHIDTRAVVKRIRKSGSMPALLSNNEHALKVITSVVEPRGQLVSTAADTVSGNGEIHIVQKSKRRVINNA
jgi:carbamoyl-phosphate synthase small subunit